MTTRRQVPARPPQLPGVHERATPYPLCASPPACGTASRAKAQAALRPQSRPFPSPAGLIGRRPCHNTAEQVVKSSLVDMISFVVDLSRKREPNQLSGTLYLSAGAAPIGRDAELTLG